MRKIVEICHFESFDQLVAKTEEISSYFRAPKKPDEHYKLVFKKKRDAEVSFFLHKKSTISKKTSK